MTHDRYDRLIMIRSLARLWNAFLLAMIAQMVLFLVIGVSEFVGLSGLARNALGAIEIVYGPALDLFFWLIPASWPSTGNVPLGLMGLGFSGALYSVLVGIITAGWSFAFPRSADSTWRMCRHCGYDLRVSTSSRCPECGRIIRASYQ